ncbi:hypothetical protein pEaSNUABM56_00189 [Erwinia phage pEa_SNUABM_56]|uniref:Uncharacterized protein n=1 Tax=Erwinia phage pEp_SNUABM_01 TaxID=2601643 RepID=A0A5J6DBR8_9CAUD|nr:hypothetical protein HWC63_gp213 [Erwinia phage pEp_SNUABM_01]QEQ94965.1 hypothetical protein pEpSNUABM01_139 [Erwinia phage pEp_SNUABM_01]UYL85209.1 hypothetical protein pEaSNUABM56_00189 [Erwinia phage pEa_SNUABM_56]
MAKYRKKPVEIEAHRFDGSSTSVGQIKNWIEKGVFRESEISTRDCGRTIEIPTLEGLMVASAGDMIIKGVKGEFYPCKPDIFAATYDLVEGETRAPGVFKAEDLISGDIFDYCGKSERIKSVENYHDQTKVFLDNGEQLNLRPYTEVVVNEVGA